MTTYLTVLTLVGLASWFIWERISPAFQRTGGSDRLARNVLLGIAGTLTTFVVVTPVSLAASGIGLDWREGWPFWLRLTTDLLALEFYIYWWHRANHEIPFLWRFHRVHHYDSFLDVTSALRFHPGEMILSAFARGLYVFLLGISIPAILIFDALVIISAGFHHSNVALPDRIDRSLRPLIVTPGHHRIHHIPKRQYTDSNYGTLVTVFDRFFGSWRDAPREGRYGVEGGHDRNFLSLVVDPVRDSS